MYNRPLLLLPNTNYTSNNNSYNSNNSNNNNNNNNNKSTKPIPDPRPLSRPSAVGRWLRPPRGIPNPQQPVGLGSQWHLSPMIFPPDVVVVEAWPMVLLE
jgi:hypothetical protein